MFVFIKHLWFTLVTLRELLTREDVDLAKFKRDPTRRRVQRCNKSHLVFYSLWFLAGIKQLMLKRLRNLLISEYQNQALKKKDNRDSSLNTQGRLVIKLVILLVCFWVFFLVVLQTRALWTDEKLSLFVNFPRLNVVSVGLIYTLLYLTPPPPLSQKTHSLLPIGMDSEFHN